MTTVLRFYDCDDHCSLWLGGTVWIPNIPANIVVKLEFNGILICTAKTRLNGYISFLNQPVIPIGIIKSANVIIPLPNFISCLRYHRTRCEFMGADFVEQYI